MSGKEHAHCLELVRTRDPDRFPALLWLPAEFRPAATALYAFNAEIVRIPALAREAEPGEIRLQWWSEVLSANRDHGGQPVAVELLAALARHRLPVQPLLDLIEAHRFDLYHDPMADIAALEAYAGHTASALLHLVALAAAGASSPRLADASGHGGVAQAIAGLCRAAGALRAGGRCYLPPDILAQGGLDASAFLAATPDERHLRSLGAFAALARQHLAKARAALAEIDKTVRPVFLPLCMVEPTLAAVERAGLGIFTAMPEISPLRRQWQYLRAALAGRP